jgi:hypothetical protein
VSDLARISDQPSVRVNRLLPAQIDEVYAAWTDPAFMWASRHRARAVAAPGTALIGDALGSRAGLQCWAPASVAGHGVAPQELGHPSCDGFGTLDVQEMADAIDRAVLDVRE